MKMLLAAAVLVGFAANACAEEKAEGPCREIKEICEKAGFVKGEAKQGYGLWMDCIDPIMQGKAQPANARKPIPSVKPELVSACKAKHPNFGQGKKKQ